MKFSPLHTRPAKIPYSVVVDVGWVLMDEEMYKTTCKIKNHGKLISGQKVSVGELTRGTGWKYETLYLVHSSQTHPNELFLPQGTWTNAIWEPEITIPDTKGLVLWEKSIATALRNGSIAEELRNNNINEIVVILDGTEGRVRLRR